MDYMPSLRRRISLPCFDIKEDIPSAVEVERSAAMAAKQNETVSPTSFLHRAALPTLPPVVWRHACNFEALETIIAGVPNGVPFNMFRDTEDNLLAKLLCKFGYKGTKLASVFEHNAFSSSSTFFSMSEMRAVLNLVTLGVTTVRWNSDRLVVERKMKAKSLMIAFQIIVYSFLCRCLGLRIIHYEENILLTESIGKMVVIQP